MSYGQMLLHLSLTCAFWLLPAVPSPTPHPTALLSPRLQAKQEVKSVITQYTNNELEPLPGNTMQQAFEGRLNSVLNKARDDAGKKAQESLTLHVSTQRGGRGGQGGAKGGMYSCTGVWM
jgi:hypothetical protein